MSLFLQLLVITGICTNYFALVKIRRYSESDYSRLGMKRDLHKGMHLLGIFLPGIGAITGFYWLLVTKPRLDSLGLTVSASVGQSTSLSQGVQTLSSRSESGEDSPTTILFSSVGTSGVMSKSESEAPSSALEYKISIERHEVFNFTSSVLVGFEQLISAIKGSIEVFRVTPETMTGLALARLLKQDGVAVSFHGLELCEYFLMGSAVGKIVFPNSPAEVDLLDLGDKSEIEDYLLAAREDADFFGEVSDAAFHSFLSSLPESVKQVLEEALLEEEASQTDAAILTKMFLSGIVFIGFQVSTVN